MWAPLPHGNAHYRLVKKDPLGCKQHCRSAMLGSTYGSPPIALAASAATLSELVDQWHRGKAEPARYCATDKLYQNYQTSRHPQQWPNIVKILSVDIKCLMTELFTPTTTKLLILRPGPAKACLTRIMCMRLMTYCRFNLTCKQVGIIVHYCPWHLTTGISYELFPNWNVQSVMAVDLHAEPVPNDDQSHSIICNYMARRKKDGSFPISDQHRYVYRTAKELTVMKWL